jgi:hypothetical protein
MGPSAFSEDPLEIPFGLAGREQTRSAIKPLGLRGDFGRETSSFAACCFLPTLCLASRITEEENHA